MNTLITRLAAILFATMPLLCLAQEKTRFIVTDPIYKSTYNGEKVKRMKFKEIKDALLSTGDEQVAHDVQKLASKRSVSGVFTWTGIVLVGVGAGMNLASTASDVRTVKTGRTSSGSSGGGLAVLGAGVVLELIGAIAHSGYKRTLKHAIYRHNDVIGGTSFVPGTTSINGQTALGASLIIRF